MNGFPDILRAVADRLEVNGGDVGEVVALLSGEKGPTSFAAAEYSALKKGGELKSRRDVEQGIVNDIVMKAMYGN